MTFNGPIGDLIKFSIGGGWGSDEEKSGYSEVAVIRGTDIPKVAMGDFSTVPHRFESNKKLTNRLLKTGDVVLETAGGSSANGQFTGRTLLITEEILHSLGPSICASFCKRLELNTDIVEPGYFYWYMQDLYSSGRVAIYDSQSTGISNFQFSSFLESEILELPDLAAQKALANSLSNINALINLKSENAQLLEQIAQTIFKSWFIDFDPVRAKMVSEKPVGMDDATAALFPDSMEDSELGPIPKGWEIRSIDSFGKVVTGKTPSTKNSDYWGEEIPFVTIPDMHGQGLIVDTKRFLSKSGADSQKNQYLKKGSILVSCIATPGLVAYATELCQSNQQINSVIPNEEHPSSWLYLHLKNMIPAFVNRSGIGTVFPNLNKNDFSSIQSIVSTKEIRFAYAGIVDSVYRKIEALCRETHTLESLRDSLLPRLISGELQIPEEMLVS